MSTESITLEPALARQVATGPYLGEERNENQPTVYILGNGELGNGLLAYYLHTQGGINCKSVQNWNQLAEQPTRGAGLLLLDMIQRDWQWLGPRLADMESDGLAPYPMALFNLERDAGIEPLALAAGVRGFFYTQDPPRVILKGIEALFKGELWVSRKLMSECLMQGIGNGGKSGESRGSSERLSQREREILSLVSQGKTNQDIAQRLFISLHTVKTHVYNIFRKLEVANRIQAANWARQNLDCTGILGD